MQTTPSASLRLMCEKVFAEMVRLYEDHAMLHAVTECVSDKLVAETV